MSRAVAVALVLALLMLTSTSHDHVRPKLGRRGDKELNRPIAHTKEAHP